MPGLRRNPATHWCDLFDRTLVLLPTTDEVVHLTSTSAAVWGAFQQERTLQQAVDALCDQYADGERATIEREVEIFVGELEELGLLIRSP